MLFGGRRGVSSHDFGVVKGFSQGFGMEEVFSLMILGWERRSPTPMQWDDDGWGVLEGGKTPVLHPSSGTLRCRGAAEEMSYRIPCTKLGCWEDKDGKGSEELEKGRERLHPGSLVPGLGSLTAVLSPAG